MFGKMIAAIVLISIQQAANAEAFVSSADCLRRHKELDDEGRYYDEAWADCAAGASFHRLADCRGLEAYARRTRVNELARRRDDLLAQARQLRPLCDQMAANERNRARESAQQTASANQRYEQQQAERQRQISINQYNADRRAEAMASADAQRRAQAMLQLQQQQIAAQDRASKKAAAIGGAAALLGMILERPKHEEEVEEKKDLSDTQRTYSNVQDGAEKLHEAVQDHQPEVVNEFQKKAWENIRNSHMATLGQVDKLGSTLASIKVDSEGSGQIVLRTSTLPAVNPWADVPDQSAARSTEDQSPSTKTREFVHPQSWETYQIEPGQTLFRDIKDSTLKVVSLKAVKTQIGDRPGRCTKDGIGLVDPACEIQRWSSR